MSQDLDKVIERLRERKQTLCFAESCTGGLLSSVLTAEPGISDIYVGGVVAYANSIKENVLKVPAHILRSVGAVSTPVALSMARGAKALTGATWAVSITGIAGPSGGSDRKPVGTVCFAIIGPGLEWSIQESFKGSRTEVQKASAEFAIKWLLEKMQ